MRNRLARAQQGQLEIQVPPFIPQNGCPRDFVGVAELTSLSVSVLSNRSQIRLSKDEPDPRESHAAAPRGIQSRRIVYVLFRWFQDSRLALYVQSNHSDMPSYSQPIASRIQKPVFLSTSLLFFISTLDC